MSPPSDAPPGDRPLRVGINLLWLVPGVVGGSEEYTVRLLRALAELAPEDLELDLFALEDLRRAHPDLAETYRFHSLGLRGRAKPLRVAAETTWLAAAVKRSRLDVVHHGGGVVPILRGGAAAVLTIHDLQPLDHPENFSPIKVAYLRRMIPRSARVAAVITTPSRTAADRVVERLGVARSRVRPVVGGLDADRQAPVSAAEVDAVRAAHGLPDRWILYPVITYPHKNHVTLIRAFARLAASHPDLDLVLTGGEGPAEAEVRAAIEASGVAPRVHRTGRVPRAELDALTAGAAAVAFPSRYEGYGIGVLEGMVRGVPVVAADRTALPEIVGDAGLLVDPDDVEGWVRALSAVLDRPDLRQRLIRAGTVRAGELTARTGAATLADAFRVAAGRPPRDAAPDSSGAGEAG